MNIDLHANIDEKFPAIRQWLCEKTNDRQFLLGILGEEKYIAYLKQFQTANKVISPQKFAQSLWSELITHAMNNSDEKKIFKQISDHYDTERIAHRKSIDQLKERNQLSYNKVMNYIGLIGINSRVFLDKVPNANFLAEHTFKEFVEEIYSIYRIAPDIYDNDEKMIKLILSMQIKYESILADKYARHLEEAKQFSDYGSENEDNDDEQENEKVIQNGKAIQYDDLVKLMREYDNKHCRICLGEYVANDEVLITDPCKHMFHKSCLEKWMKATCPMCRADIRPI